MLYIPFYHSNKQVSDESNISTLLQNDENHIDFEITYFNIVFEYQDFMHNKVILDRYEKLAVYVDALANTGMVKSLFL